jgi:hypothetical protein
VKQLAFQRALEIVGLIDRQDEAVHHLLAVVAVDLGGVGGQDGEAVDLDRALARRGAHGGQ